MLSYRARSLLADPDPEVVAAAIAALSRMERFHRELVRNPNEVAQLADVIHALPNVRGQASSLN